MNTGISAASRLKTLEASIRKHAEQIQKNGIEIGRGLCQIRDEDLWKATHKSWDQYLKEMAEELVGKSFSQAQTLMDAAVIEKKIPESFLTSKTGMSASGISELRRLAPRIDGTKQNEADYSKIRTQDVARVLKRAVEIAKEESPSKESPSVRDVRKAVDVELGVDRMKQAKDRQAELDRVTGKSGIDLDDYLRQKIGVLRGITANLENVPGDGWRQLVKKHPKLCEELATECDILAALLRS